MAKNKLWFLNVLVLLFVAYLLFLCYKAIASNYKTTARINVLEEEIALANEEKEFMEALNLYYGTNTFRELEARRKLGLKLPDEQVVRVPLREEEKLSDISVPTSLAKGKGEEGGSFIQEANSRKWLRFVLRI
ncbi:MAG TPA: hypothetical protein PLX55_02715 [bacterium]|jgi:hypothetical protein|nr:hypothetical protein [bacterium]